MNTPKVSVIVPMYNSATFLDRCITSLLNQTLKEIEIILVNDASPDNSLDIAHRFAKDDSRIHIVDLKKNVIASRNYGIKIAQANYLGFVDADDWVEPDFYERLYYATKSETIDVVFGEINSIHSSGKIVPEKVIPNYLCENADSVKAYIAVNGGRLLSNLWKRSLITQDIFFKEQNLYCDSIVSLWYFKANSFSKVDGTWYNYYINGLSITHMKNSSKIFDRLDAAIDMLERSRKIGLYDIYHKEIDYKFYRLYYRNSLLVFCDKFTKLPVDKIREMVKYINKNIDLKKNEYYISQIDNIGDLYTKALDRNFWYGIFVMEYMRRYNRFIIPIKSYIRSKLVKYSLWKVSF